MRTCVNTDTCRQSFVTGPWKSLGAPKHPRRLAISDLYFTALDLITDVMVLDVDIRGPAIIHGILRHLNTLLIVIRDDKFWPRLIIKTIRILHTKRWTHLIPRRPDSARCIPLHLLTATHFTTFCFPNLWAPWVAWTQILTSTCGRHGQQSSRHPISDESRSVDRLIADPISRLGTFNVTEDALHCTSLFLLRVIHKSRSVVYSICDIRTHRNHQMYRSTYCFTKWSVNLGHFLVGTRWELKSTGVIVAMHSFIPKIMRILSTQHRWHMVELTSGPSNNSITSTNLHLSLFIISTCVLRLYFVLAIRSTELPVTSTSSTHTSTITQWSSITFLSRDMSQIRVIQWSTRSHQRSRSTRVKLA